MTALSQVAAAAELDTACTPTRTDRASQVTSKSASDSMLPDVVGMAGFESSKLEPTDDATSGSAAPKAGTALPAAMNAGVIGWALV
jgi:hypothetical protein